MTKLKDFGKWLLRSFVKLLRALLPWARRAVFMVGVIGLLLIVLAFTRVPFDAHRWLGLAAGECDAPVDVILVLGGSGMPSGPELVRMYHGAELAAQWPDARIVLIHPGPPSTLLAMAAELRLRGVAEERITLVNEGNNTREQALILAQRFPAKPAIAIVTSPENTYRTVLSFRKAGWERACGDAAWDHAMLHNFDYGHEAVGGKAWMPDVSGDPDVRYTFWNYLRLEITCLREYAALSYYWLNGWI
ncbi:MAG TPA: YdcF family protein [Flavobacteriales bacterium]|nr:YdcF family protein [Flavobacteriales bacterium]